MTNAEFIKVLQTLPQDLEVCIADWSEQYDLPVVCTYVNVENGNFYPASSNEYINGEFICLSIQENY